MEGSSVSGSTRYDSKNVQYDGKNNSKGGYLGEGEQNQSINDKKFDKDRQNKIKKFRELRKLKKNRNNYTVKRSNKVVQALDLPKVLNLNPRSAMNKIDEIKTFIEEKSIDCAFISESWETNDKKLADNIKIKDHIVISNPYQRQGKGGRPALIINEAKYHVQNLTNTVLSIPWGVEITWGLITPKNVTPSSTIQNIVLGSIYSKPDSRFKTETLDHISQTYNFLNTKYEKGLYWIIAGDTNDLNLEPILSLSPNLKSVVITPTRLNPDRILDNIITDLSKWYQIPKCLPPIDADKGTRGKPSDHLTVVMPPISTIENSPARTIREVEVRPLKESRIKLLEDWLTSQNWGEVLEAKNVHDKAEIFQNLLLNAINQFLPKYNRKIASDDQPFFTEKNEKNQEKKI